MLRFVVSSFVLRIGFLLIIKLQWISNMHSSTGCEQGVSRHMGGGEDLDRTRRPVIVNC